MIRFGETEVYIHLDKVSERLLKSIYRMLKGGNIGYVHCDAFESLSKGELLYKENKYYQYLCYSEEEWVVQYEQGESEISFETFCSLFEVDIFEVNDKVYHYKYGFGRVKIINDGNVIVDFYDFGQQRLTAEQAKNTLSFKPYSLYKGGFTQVRDIIYENCINRYGIFVKDGKTEVDQLEFYSKNREGGKFLTKKSKEWKDKFIPLTRDQISSMLRK